MRRGHKLPNYTKEELKQWCLNQKKFHQLYDAWVLSGYCKSKKPSLDRTDDYKSYSLNRLQIITWKENSDKAYADIRSGKLIKNRKPPKQVEQITLKGLSIRTYVSMMEAKRITGINNSSISRVCNGEESQAGGYKWRLITSN